MKTTRTPLAYLARSAVALIGVVALVVIGTPVSPAWAADGATVSISSATRAQPSGNTFVYDLSYACSTVGTLAPDETPNCEFTTITIDLAGLYAAGFDSIQIAEMIELPDGIVWSTVSGPLVISIGELAAGNSGSLPLRITPPNHITPNDTMWEMTPVISGQNFPASTSTSTAVSTVTAEANHTIDKVVGSNAFRKPGDLVEYSIKVGCSQTAAGNLLLESMTVTDVLPDGLTFVRATPQPTHTIGGLTWELDSLPPSCTTPGAEETTTILLEAIVDAIPLQADPRTITNVAKVESIALGGLAVPVKTNPADITILGATGPGDEFVKESFGQIRDEDATSAQQEDNSHTTYPGQWIPTRTTQPANILNGFDPNHKTDMLQSGYKMEYHSGTVQGYGVTVDIVDPLPCISTANDGAHHSNEPGTLCQNPAFVATTVSVWSSAEGVAPLDETYRPIATLSNGQTYDLIPVGRSSTHVQTYSVPEIAVGSVAEIRFPANATLSGQRIRWAIFGYASEQTADSDTLHNTTRATVTWDGGSKEVTDTAVLRIVERPQTGIEKEFLNQRGGDATLRLNANLVTPSNATHANFVVTDLLPAGMTVTESPQTITAQVTENGAGAVNSDADTIEVIENYQNTGRTLIRVKWLAANHIDNAGSVGLRTQMDFKVHVREDVAGIYDNTAQVFYNHPALLSSCQQTQINVQSDADPLDLDDNGKTDDRHCWASDSIKIEPEAGSASFASTKTVQGDEDAAPQSYPGIASVGTDGGSAVFTIGWQNTGATTLSNPVTYDIFPQIGDAGVGGASAGVPRGSEFAASLVSVVAPPGVHVWYSLSGNPCRDEVFANTANVGCVDDWSLTAPADLGTVTGVKLVCEGYFAFGQGYEARLQMSVPSDISQGSVAWNSIAANAQRPDNSWMQPSAPPKVGITAEAMTMMGKRVTSDAEPLQSGDTVTFEIAATNPTATDTTITMTDVLPDGMEYVSITPAAASVQFDAVNNEIRWLEHPLAARSSQTWELTVQLTDLAAGEVTNMLTGTNVLPQTPRCDDRPDATCATVFVASGALTLTKNVTGEAAAFAPETGFEFHIVCQLGAVIVADELVTLRASETSDTVEAPLGSTCTVTETAAGGATTPAAQQVVVLDGDPAIVALEMENVFSAGYLAVEKSVTGVGAAAFGIGDYGFSVSCSFEGVALPTERVSVSVIDTAVTARSEIIGPLPVGARCAVAETGNGGADVTPEPLHLTVVAGERDTPQLAAFQNAFSAGTVEVENQISGSGADEAEEIEFEFLVTCQHDTYTQDLAQVLTIVGPGTVALLDSSGKPLLLPVGAECYMAQTESGGSDQVTIEHDSSENAVSVAPGTADEVQVIALQVENAFTAEIPPSPSPSPSPSAVDAGVDGQADQIAQTGASFPWVFTSGGFVLLMLGALVFVGRTRRV